MTGWETAVLWFLAGAAACRCVFDALDAIKDRQAKKEPAPPNDDRARYLAIAARTKAVQAFPHGGDYRLSSKSRRTS